MPFLNITQLSIKQKQMLILMLTSSVALLMASAGFIVYEMVTFEASMKTDLRRLALQIGRDNSSALVFGNPDAAQKNLDGFLQDRPEIVAACVYGPNGPLAQFPAAPLFPPPPFPPQLGSVGGKQELMSLNPRKNVLSLFMLINSGVVSPIRVPVYLESSLEPMYARLGRYGVIIFVVFGCSLFVIWIVSARLQRIISEPILQLLNTAEAVSKNKNYAVRAIKQSEDELGVLIDGFNAMLAQIQERDLDLQKAHNELERRVEHRTEALKLEIADRRRAEEAVRESDERFQLVARATNDAVWDWNLVTDNLWWNDGMRAICGCAVEEIGGSPDWWVRRLHPEDVSRVVLRKNSAIYSGESFWSDEYRFLRADGSYAHIFDRGYVIRDEQQHPVRMVGAMVDITQRKESERAQQQQLTRISLLNQITHAISERQDLQSLIHVVLEQLERHLPIDFGAILFYDAKTDLLTSAAARIRAQADAAPLPFLTRGAQFKPDELGLQFCLKGHHIHCGPGHGEEGFLPVLIDAGYGSIVASPLLEQSNTFGILICARTENEFTVGEREFLGMLSEQVALATHQAGLYTQLQNAYDELRQTQHGVIEQERLRALGQMASGIAHDINNALSPVVVYSEMLLRDNHGQPPESVKRHLHSIKTAGEDIAHIVSRMREFYRPREQDEEVLSLDLNELARQVIDLTRPRWRDIPLEHGLVVDVQTDFQPALPEIAGNASELREAMTNLMLNAVDAMPGGGKITIRTAVHLWETTSVGRQATHIVYEVRDTGVGMNEDTRTRCLEPFFTTKGQRGTGLGLAMVYGVAERHEAKIEIESKVGHGTTIRLVFPLRQLAAASEPDTVIIARQHPLRILCIDDEPLLREMLKEILQLDGHYVELAADGEAGIAAFLEARHRKPFQLVITDLGMPRVDGRQLAATLKKEVPTIPIIMLTGWGTMMKADGDMPSQVDCVLGKPPRMAELREAIQRITARPF